MNKKWWLIAFIVCMLLVTISPLASSSPDGLEKVAEDKGFIGLAKGSPFEIVTGYLFPGIENEVMAKILAGWAGTILLFGVTYVLAWLVKSRKSKTRLN